MRALGLVCLIAALLAGGRASAHAQLVAAEPAAGSVVAAAPAEVVLTFSEPVRPLAARWFPAGGADPIEVAPTADGDRIVAPLPAAVGGGTLVLSWRVVSLDGHPIGGSHVFSVGTPTAGAAAPSARAPWGAAAGRGLLTLTLVFGVGGAVCLRFVDRGSTPLPVARRVALWSALATVPAAVLATGLQGLDLLGLPAAALSGPAPWAAAAGSRFGAMAAASLVAGLAAAVALGRMGGGLLAGGAWALAAASFALFGHAAAAPPRWLTAPAIALHAGAAIFWIGALPALVERAAQRDRALVATLRGFSTLAVPLVALLVASGAALAAVQVRAPSLLFGSTYGRLLALKLSLVAVLLLLAALNRYRLTPAIEAGVAAAPARFRRSAAAEIALALVILALVAGFRLTPPPRSVAAAPAEVRVHLHGPTVTADVTLTPGRAGANRAEIALADAGGGPIAPLEVRVSLADPARGVEPIRLEAVRRGEVWQAGPIELPHGGDWTIGLDVLVSDFAGASLEATAAVGER